MRKISQKTEMTLVTLTLTLGPQGHQGMLNLSIPTYHVNMVMIGGHEGSQMPIPRFDLERPIFDLEGKKSKFRFLQFLCIVPKNISVRFQPFPIKTVGGVRKSTKK